MTGKLAWIWRQTTGRFWFRVSLYGAAAVTTALVSTWIAPLLPSDFAERIRPGTARDMLTIIATSMLAVATFSLGSMVQAFGAAASLATPRATKVLIEDPVSQNVLSTFLGAFVFSIVGLFGESIGYYTKAGEAVILLAAGAVLTLVVVTFFGWLDHLAHLVRLGETVRKVEIRAEESLRARAKAPLLGGAPLGTEAPGNWPVTRDWTGYLLHIDMKALQRMAEAAGGVVTIAALPGTLINPNRPLATTSWHAGPEDLNRLCAAFTLDRERDFEQDPRFCLSVLCEIGSRALSSGINDAGTALSIITTQQRLLTLWARDSQRDAAVLYDRVRVPAIAIDDLFEDAFGPMLRDGADTLEVGARLQKALVALAGFGPPAFREAATRLSAKALRHAREALPFAEDQALLAEIARPLHSRPPA